VANRAAVGQSVLVESLVRVSFVGSGDAFGSGGRLQTCILVEDGNWRCLLDCGTTSLVGLKRAGVDPASITAIVVSHLHGDHFGGLPFFLLDAQFNSRRGEPLLLIGHEDLEGRLRGAMEVLFPGSRRAFEVVDARFIRLAPGAPTPIGSGAVVEAFDVNHFCGSPPFALRLTTPSGRVIAYSGDTEWTDSLVDAARGADLFIVETYYYDKAVKWHLSYSTLAANLTRLAARQIVGTHLSADLLQRLNGLAIPVAHDGMTIELS
jgi:ribonuclease BN (tRNA processing enzyme)